MVKRYRNNKGVDVTIETDIWGIPENRNLENLGFSLDEGIKWSSSHFVSYY